MTPAAVALVPAVDGIGFGNWFWAAVTLVIALLLAALARWFVRRVDRRHHTVTSSVQIMARVVFSVIAATGLYIALRIIGLDLGPVLGGAGILGIAVAFALRDIAENYISGVLMGFRNPFSPGDQIVSGDFEGTVVELNLRHTAIDTHDGLRVLLPNGGVLKNPLTNLTVNGARRTDFELGVAYGTDLRRACTVVLEALDAVPEVHAEPAPEAWVEVLAPSWVTVRVRYWHEPRSADVWRARHAAIVAVVGACEAAGIDLPLEQRAVEVSGGLSDPGSR